MKRTAAKNSTGVVFYKQRFKQFFGVTFYVDSLFLILNSVLSSILGFVFWIAVARFYRAETVGISSAVLSAAALLIFVSGLGLGQGLIRFLPGAGSKTALIINTCFTLSGFTAIAAVAVFITIIPLWLPALDFVLVTPYFVTALIVFAVAGTVFSLLDQVFLALKGARFVLTKNILQNLLKVVLVFFRVSRQEVFNIFVAHGIATVIAMLAGVFLFLPRMVYGYRPAPVLRGAVGREMVRFSFANYIAEGLWNAPNWLLPVIGVNLLGGAVNAYFFVSWAFASLLFAVPAAASAIMFAEGSYEEDLLAGNIKRSLKLSVVLLLPVIAFMLTAGDKLLFVFGGEYSAEGLQLLRVLAPSSLFLAINSIYLGTARVKKKLKDIILLAAAVSVGTLGLTCLLTPCLGVLGFGVSWLMSHGAVAAVVGPKLVKQLRAGVTSGASADSQKG